jgi:hypothetical protein
MITSHPSQTMPRLLSPARRRYLADKFGQLANTFAASLILGQFLAPERVDLPALGVGVLGTLGFYIAGFFLEEPPSYPSSRT